MRGNPCETYWRIYIQYTTYVHTLRGWEVSMKIRVYFINDDNAKTLDKLNHLTSTIVIIIYLIVFEARKNDGALCEIYVQARWINRP